MLCDIIQIYIQSKTELNCIVIYYLSLELKKKYSESIILHVIKPLYDIAEAKNYQFIIYLDYRKEKLDIEMLFYNAYLLIIKNKGINFGITRLQIGNTLNVGTEIFINKKEAKIIKIKFKAKSQIMLATNIS